MFAISFILSFLLLITSSDYPERVFFQSQALQGLGLTPLEDNFSILDDNGKQVKIIAMEDAAGVRYWHRKVLTAVCLTGECKMVNIGIYWYCNGDFMGLEVYGEHLTKTDHSVFSDADYDKLLGVLNDDWSSLREYGLSDLMTEGAESEAGADGTTGATKKELAEEAVDGAVYTTFTLWHLAHSGEKEQLSQLTAGLLKDESLVERMLKQGDKRYRYFLLELLAAGKIAASGPLTLLQIESLNAAGDLSLRDLSIKALSHANFDHPLIQPELAKIYPQAPIDAKLRILAALEDMPDMDKALCQALTADLGTGNKWFSIKLLKVLQGVANPGDKTLKAAEKLLKSDNSMVQEAAAEFMESQKNKR